MFKKLASGDTDKNQNDLNRDNNDCSSAVATRGPILLILSRLHEVDPARLLAWAELCSILPNSANHSLLLIY